MTSNTAAFARSLSLLNISIYSFKQLSFFIVRPEPLSVDKTAGNSRVTTGEVDSSEVGWDPCLPAPGFQPKDLDITDINIQYYKVKNGLLGSAALEAVTQ